LEYQHIKTSKKDGVTTITICRPDVLNALNTAALNELIGLFTELDADAETGAAILTGEGRAFAAGADIAQMRGFDAAGGRAFTLLWQRLTTVIEACGKPVVAAVNGYALGGGCELALACDIRIASDKAKFGQPEVGLGVIPGAGGTQRLPRAVGRGMAKYMIFTGEMIGADEAFRIGIVEKVVPADKLLDECERVARLILTKSGTAVRMAKRAIDVGMNVDLGSGLAYEAEAYAVSFASDDRTAGMSAFLEKRAPEFPSRANCPKIGE